MLSRAKLLSGGTAVQPFDWGAGPVNVPELVRRSVDLPAGTVHPDAIERDAFLKGYSQGEQAGAQVAAKRGEGMLRRLSETLDELATLRADLLHRSETQMVQLALAIARRVVRREISIDRSLLVGMARVALDRLGEHMSATVRLHPEDHAAVSAGLPGEANPLVTVVPDASVSRGSCLVESDFGFMDLSPETQFEELARTLLEDTGATALAPVRVKAIHAAPSE